jgi:hypothetical protein
VPQAPGVGVLLLGGARVLVAVAEDVDQHAVSSGWRVRCGWLFQ